MQVIFDNVPTDQLETVAGIVSGFLKQNKGIISIQEVFDVNADTKLVITKSLTEYIYAQFIQEL